jgi:hydroxymethylpyrimidine/phosphomethylpyrimidine kinase
MKHSMKELHVVTSVAGSDSGAGAGIQADLLTFAALGVFGTTAITSLTAQNPKGVKSVMAVTPEFLRDELDQLAAYFKIRSLKTGMLYDAALIGVTADFLSEHREFPAVIDPVMVATSGAMLLKPDAVATMRDRLFPLATLVTPNLDEAGVLLGKKPESVAEMREASAKLVAMTHTNVLLKGGHLVAENVTDVLAMSSGLTMELSDPRVDGVNTHGSGCTLSAAIAAYLGLGEGVEEAVGLARRYLLDGMKQPIAVAGDRFIAHLRDPFAEGA